MKIEIKKNNTETLTFTLKIGTTPYDITSGNQVKFTVKKSVTDSDEKAVITKTLTGEDSNVLVVSLTGADTNISCGVYKWDLKNITTNKTLCNYDDFIISEVVYNG